MQSSYTTGKTARDWIVVLGMRAAEARAKALLGSADDTRWPRGSGEVSGESISIILTSGGEIFFDLPEYTTSSLLHRQQIATNH